MHRVHCASAGAFHPHDGLRAKGDARERIRPARRSSSSLHACLGRFNSDFSFRDDNQRVGVLGDVSASKETFDALLDSSGRRRMRPNDDDPERRLELVVQTNEVLVQRDNHPAFAVSVSRDCDVGRARVERFDRSFGVVTLPLQPTPDARGNVLVCKES